MNKKVCSFPILFALLALLIGICAVVFPRIRAGRAERDRIHHGDRHRGAQLRHLPDLWRQRRDDDSDAKIATDLVWASDAVRDAALPVLHSAGCPIPRPLRRKLPSGSTPIPTLRAR